LVLDTKIFGEYPICLGLPLGRHAGHTAIGCLIERMKINVALSKILTITFLASVLHQPAALALGDGCFDGFAGGFGDEDEPFQITDVREFKEISECSSQFYHYKLMEDLDFTDDSGLGITSFKGVFDGNGKTIRNLNLAAMRYQGAIGTQALFHYVSGTSSKPTVIKNLKLDSFTIPDMGAASRTGLVASVEGVLEMRNVQIKDFNAQAESQSAAALIGYANITDLVLEGINLHGSLNCKTEADSIDACSPLIAEARFDSSISISDTYVDVLLKGLETGTGENQGGLLGFVTAIVDDVPDPSNSISISDTAVKLQIEEGQTAGRFGGVIGRFDEGSSDDISIDLDRFSLAGEIPDATDLSPGIGFFFGSDPTNTTISLDEVVLGPSIGTATGSSGFFIGEAKDSYLPNIEYKLVYHDTSFTDDTGFDENGIGIVKFDPSNASSLDTYEELTITDNLSPVGVESWYVQEPDTEGTADGLGEDGYIGSIFDGYPVPFAVASAGFLGNRFYFQKNDGSGEFVGRLGYASGGLGIDVIPNPFSRDGFEFTSWSNSETDGDIFEVGQSINGFDNADIYAQWQEVFTVSFRGTGSDSGSAPASIPAKPTFTVPGPGTLEKADHEFAGWAVPRTTPPVVYQEGEVITAEVDLVLNSTWRQLFDVSFNTGGADSGSVAAQTDKTSITAPDKGNLLRDDYQFTGWQDQDGTNYAVGDTVNLTKDLTLTAQWQQLFDVSFNSGGADSGSVAAQTDKTSITVPNKGDLVRDGYEFAGWKDADGNSYTAGQNLNLTKDLTLTAQWNELPPPAPAPAPVYMGPIVTGVEQPENKEFTTSGLRTVIVNGMRLNTVNSAIIDGVTVEVTEASYTSFSFVLPAGLEPGVHDLTVKSAYGTLLYRNSLEIKKVVTPEPEIEPDEIKPKQKVNAGSFKGFVAVYALGHEGSRLSAKIGRDWVVIPSIPARDNNLFRMTDFTGAGVDIQVRIYIDRVLMETIPLTTK